MPSSGCRARRGYLHTSSHMGSHPRRRAVMPNRRRASVYRGSPCCRFSGAFRCGPRRRFGRTPCNTGTPRARLPPATRRRPSTRSRQRCCRARHCHRHHHPHHCHRRRRCRGRHRHRRRGLRPGRTRPDACRRPPRPGPPCALATAEAAGACPTTKAGCPRRPCPSAGSSGATFAPAACVPGAPNPPPRPHQGRPARAESASQQCAWYRLLWWWWWRCCCCCCCCCCH